MKIKKVDLSNNSENTALFFLDKEGDLFETREDAELLGIDKEILVDGWYPGSMEEWKKSILTRI